MHYKEWKIVLIMHIIMKIYNKFHGWGSSYAQIKENLCK